MINEQIRVPINGVCQFISIRSEKTEMPLLLYLHGGPGDAALPIILKYNRYLEKHFTVVVWEQRGAGKSYYPFSKHSSIKMEIFQQDLLCLIQYLLEKYRQKKIFLVGHSWGSVLGLRFIKQYPEYIYAYVGCGQVVNMEKSCRAAYEYAWEKANEKEKRRLAAIDCTYTNENWLNELLFVTRLVIKYQGSLYGERSYGKLTIPFLFSKYYSILDLIRRRKGSIQSIRCFWQELMKTDFEMITDFEVPVIFAEGRHDKHVSSDLVETYYRRIKSKKELVWFEHSCHFPQWSENECFHQLMLRIRNEFTGKQLGEESYEMGAAADCHTRR